MADPTPEIAPLEDLKPLKAERRVLVGLDLGTKTIGVAVSDRGWQIASPLTLIRRTKFAQDAALLAEILAEHHAAAVILGLPVNMDGTEGPRAQATRAFARNFAPIGRIPIVLWDERLSTAAVTRTLIDADVSRKRRAGLVDKMAAAYILQGALDRLRNDRGSSSDTGVD